MYVCTYVCTYASFVLYNVWSIGWSQGRVLCVAQEAAKATEHGAPVDEEGGHVAVLWPHCQWVLTGHVQRNLQDVLACDSRLNGACRMYEYWPIHASNVTLRLCILFFFPPTHTHPHAHTTHTRTHTRAYTHTLARCHHHCQWPYSLGVCCHNRV